MRGSDIIQMEGIWVMLRRAKNNEAGLDWVRQLLRVAHCDGQQDSKGRVCSSQQGRGLQETCGDGCLTAASFAGEAGRQHVWRPEGKVPSSGDEPTGRYPEAGG
jgi:hypothetical protein